MVFKSPVPIHSPIIPPPLITSFQIRDHLSTQRDLAQDVLFACLDVYQDYYTNGFHPLVTPDAAERAIRNTDHTTLRPTRDETTEFMQRMVWEATTPFAMRSITTWVDGPKSIYTDKITPLIEGLADHPTVGITLVSHLGFPHGHTSPDQAARAIDEAREMLRDFKGPIDFDTVLRYRAWMQGDRHLVESILKVEGEATRRNGFDWKVIQNVGVHAKADMNKIYGSDFFRSVYDSTILSLEAGADFAKTSTGMSAEPPFNYFDPKDTGIIYRSIPMLIALADFNRKNGTQRLPKFSGGNENEADAAVAYLACRMVLGPELADKIVFGTSYRFRGRLLRSIAETEGDNCRFDRQILAPYGIDESQIRQPLRGLPRTPDLLLIAPAA